MNNTVKSLVLVVVGIALGVVVMLFVNGGGDSNGAMSSSNNEPLYWVAPMDPNYRRDKPGKSPMGMDLIPVYEEDGGGEDIGPGAVSIAPEVVQNLGVRTAEVVRQPMHSEIRTVGYIQYDEDKLVHVHPRISGWIEKLHVNSSGDPVSEGQPLYEIYSPELVNAQEELLLALERNNARLLRAAEERLVSLQLPKDAIQALKKSRRVQQRVTFYSPIDGVVDDLSVREGFFVKPDKNRMVIGSLEDVWVEVEIFERQASLVKAGNQVSMTLGYVPGRQWQGVVDYVYPTLDPKTRTVKVRLRFDNEDGQLKPNMFAQVAIHTEGMGSALVVPREAVIRTGKMDRVVLALADGRFKSLQVTLGRVGNEFVEVREGVKEGEKVVTSAQFLIDSESSISSDFKRMASRDDKPSSVWVEGTLHQVNTKAKTVNASHSAIEAWEWPAMTMDFGVSDAVDISQLSAGMSLHMQIIKEGNDYVIGGVHIMDDMGMGSASKEDSEPDNAAEVDGVINSVMASHRMLNISRGPIEKWNREAATLNFWVDDAVDMAPLREGMTIRFTFVVKDGEFTVTAIHDMEGQ